MSRRRRLLIAGTAAASVAVLAAGFTANAWAAEGDIGIAAVVGGTKVRYKAAYEKTNAVVVTRSGNTVTIDDKREIKAGTGCKRVKGDKTRVKCRTSKAPTRVTVFAYDRNDTVTNKTDLPMTADGGEGNDKIVGGPRGDNLDGGAGDDKLYGAAGNDRITGSLGNDYVSGGVGNDQIEGDWGNDRLYGGAGNDRFIPDKGADFISGDTGDDFAEESAGNDVFHGGNGNDIFLGGTGDDKAYGGAGNDSLDGQEGRDRLEGQAGDDSLTGDDARRATPVADVLLGGTGRDQVVYNYHRKPVVVDLDGATGDDGQAGEKDTVGADVEDIVGGAGNDRLTGNAAANKLSGHGGADTLRGGAGNDELEGAAGRDTLYGDAGDDFLNGFDDTTTNEVDRLDGGAHTAGDHCAPTAADTVLGCEDVQPWVL